MHAASRHGTPGLTFLPKDDEVSCEVRPPRSPVAESCVNAKDSSENWTIETADITFNVFIVFDTKRIVTERVIVRRRVWA